MAFSVMTNAGMSRILNVFNGLGVWTPICVPHSQAHLNSPYLSGEATIAPIRFEWRCKANEPSNNCTVSRDWAMHSSGRAKPEWRTSAWAGICGSGQVRDTSLEWQLGFGVFERGT